jgi:alkylation response protein AidB-like acyl-CoA dehydrogenase
MDTAADDFDQLASLQALTEGLRARAGAVDAAGLFPEEDFARLRRRGLLAAPLPRRFGGQGLGTEPGGAMGLLALLRAIGEGSIATGRLFEAHVNALKLIGLYGSEAQMAEAAKAVHAGHVFGLWVTETPPGLVLQDGMLQGAKSLCSGAGHVTRALVTASAGGAEPVLAVVPLRAGERVMPGAPRLTGVHGAVTAGMDLSGLPADAIGHPGDYLRQPEFSAGAWRTSAVTLGGLEALGACVRRALVERGRAGNPHQQTRLGYLRIEEETARLWLERTAPIAESRTHDPGDVAELVNLARIAVECAALRMIELAQRSLGLAAFIAGQEVERLIRDLSTYLRQPAPDETLTEAAAWFTTRDLPRSRASGDVMP